MPVAVRKRAVAALCLALLLLGGCGGLSNGEYYREREHAGHTEEAGTLGANAIGNYYTLQTALQNMIRSARESDSIRVSDYNGDLDEDLEKIRQYFTTVYPLGVYAVQGIGYDKTRVLSAMEISVTVQYRRTPEEIRSVVELLDEEEFERSMTEFFRAYGSKKVFSFTWFTDSDETFMNRIMKSWAAAGEYAVALDGVSFTCYPEDGYRRIVEIDARYLEEPEDLAAQTQKVGAQADEIVRQLPAGETQRETLSTLTEWLLGNVRIDEEATRVIRETGGLQKKTPVYTAYGALVERAAAQSGLVLAAEVLGSRLGLSCTVVIGSRDGEAYWWLAVRTDEGWLHLDLLSEETVPAVDGEDGAVVLRYIFGQDEAARRFAWDEALYRFD